MLMTVVGGLCMFGDKSIWASFVPLLNFVVNLKLLQNKVYVKLKIKSLKK